MELADADLDAAAGGAASCAFVKLWEKGELLLQYEEGVAWTLPAFLCRKEEREDSTERR
jgi:hypothetical protein